MAVGRFTGDRLVDRFGPVMVARTSLFIAFAGLSLVVLAGSPIEVIAGFAMAGIGVATGFPLSATAAAGRGDRPPAVNVASLQVVGIGAFLLTPPLIGGVAELTGLRVGIAAVLPMIVVSFVLARELTRKVATPGQPAN
jgi:MFS family permease